MLEYIWTSISWIVRFASIARIAFSWWDPLWLILKVFRLLTWMAAGWFLAIPVIFVMSGAYEPLANFIAYFMWLDCAAINHDSAMVSLGIVAIICPWPGQGSGNAFQNRAEMIGRVAMADAVDPSWHRLENKPET